MVRRGMVVALLAFAGLGVMSGSAFAVVGPADIEVLATGPSQVPVNTQATYTVTVRNIGPTALSGSDTFSTITFTAINWSPTWKRFVSLTCDKGTFVPSNVNAPGCDLALGAGEVATLRLTLEADEFVRDGRIRFQESTYTPDYPDSNAANNAVDFPVKFVLPVGPGGGAGGDSGGDLPGPPVVSSTKLIARGQLPDALRAQFVAVATFNLSEAGRITATVRQQVKGRKRNGRCSRTAKRGPRCRVYVKRGSFGADGKLGANAVGVPLKLGGKTLKRGTYRLELRVTDAAGTTSRLIRITFKVVT